MSQLAAERSLKLYTFGKSLAISPILLYNIGLVNIIFAEIIWEEAISFYLFLIERIILMIRRDIKKVISAILIGAMTFAVIPQLPQVNETRQVYADELEEAKQKKEAASAKKKEAQSRLKTLNQAKEDTMDMIQKLDAEIESYEGKIKDLEGKKIKLQTQVAVVENSLQEAYIQESKQYSGMKERIQFAYENGDATYISALLAIKDYTTVNNQAEYVDKVSVYDQKQLGELLEIEETIDDLKKNVEENLYQVKDLKEEAEGEQQALGVMQEGKKEALKEYSAEITETEYSIEQLEALEAELDAQIAAIEAAAAAARAAAEAAAREAAEQAAAAAAAAAASGTDAQQQAVPVTNMPSYGGGAFVWPMPSSHSIGSGFGPRKAPIAGASTYHKGVDIGCAAGAPIVAAADGVVSYTGYFGGGGNTVIIDHGNGLSTLYMHMSSFGTSVGASVTAGTTIGYAGSTGVSTGPHLHFAVRVNGSYVDPMGYL